MRYENNPYIFDIAENTTVKAFFVEKEEPQPQPTLYTLTIEKDGQGSVVCDKEGFEFEPNTTLTLTANAADGWEFSYWTINGGRRVSNPYTFVISENTTVKAFFEQKEEPIVETFQVFIQAGENGSVSPKYNGESVEKGTVIDITATPDDGYKFDKWKEDGNTNAERTITVDEEIHLTALFVELDMFQLKVWIEPEESGIVYFNGSELNPGSDGSLSKSYVEGKKVKLEAEPYKGYVFSHYEEGSNEIEDAEYTVTMNKRRTITAVFKKKAQGIDDVQSDNEQCTKVYRDGQIYILRGDKMYTLTGQEIQ